MHSQAIFTQHKTKTFKLNKLVIGEINEKVRLKNIIQWLVWSPDCSWLANWPNFRIQSTVGWNTAFEVAHAASL